MALLGLCPQSLYDRLMLQPNVATGKISFDELEGLIMSAVNGEASSKKGIHNCEPVGPSNHGDSPEFELGGELY